MNQPKDYVIDDVDMSLSEYDTYMSKSPEQKREYLEELRECQCSDPVRDDIKDILELKLEERKID